MVSLVLVFYCGPRWGKENMLVYISICSLIGSISVVFTQGLGSAIVHSITFKNENQFNNWFIYVVLAIVIITLIIEIVYLNKALNLFNTALVTPTYYVIFTTMTIVSSIVLYRGFDASPVDIATCVIGFLSICSGVSLLHNSKSEPEPDHKQDDEENEKCLTDGMDSPLRRKSVFSMFESKNQLKVKDDDRDSHPSAADLFPAPFSAISRYASTTKRSQSILTRQRLTPSPSSEDTQKKRPHSNTISIGNTLIGEEGYNRELRWRDYPTQDINSPIVGQYHGTSQEKLQEDVDFKSINTTITSSTTSFGRKHSTSISSPNTAQHRAQNELGPISSFKLQIYGGESDDRKGLVEDWNKTTN